MSIPSVEQGVIRIDEKVYNPDSCDGAMLDSPRGSVWLETIGSFRYEPEGDNKSYTVRKEAGKGGDYWYAYRKVAGKLHKKYIGKSSELSTAKLEEIAEALNTPQQPRVTQVTEANNQRVTDTVTDRDTAERVTALELQFQALQESLEELRSVLLGKSEGLSDSPELLKPNEVTDSELQTENQQLLIELGNLTAENQKVRADYAALLESSTAVTKKLEREVQELRSQLETEKTRGEELWEELSDTEQALADLRSENSDLKKTCSDLRSELSDLKQKSAPARKDFPDAADVLNQLKKAKGKKFTASLADVESILEILEES